MCGRYVLALRAAEYRQMLQDFNVPVDDYPDDEATRQTYNFAPGYHGLVYRADTGDRGGGYNDNEDAPQGATNRDATAQHSSKSKSDTYKIQAMKWGLIPFWTKRAPDYSSQLKTINARDDSLAENKGMWTSMKKHKRCIVIAQGFYEWLKKNNGKEKIPHYIKRKDGQLMLMAGLWDCVQYEDKEDKIYSYTIITTDSNRQLNFLHDRMPVIMDPGSEEWKAWLDPDKAEWSKELQSILRPYQGELEVYPVAKEVGKVGNNSPTFIVPIDSKENKQNIANFFQNAKAVSKTGPKTHASRAAKPAPSGANDKRVSVKEEEDEKVPMKEESGTEDNAPLPASPPKSAKKELHGVKREHDDKDIKQEEIELPPAKTAKTNAKAPSPTKQSPPKRKTRSATSNASTKRAQPTSSQKITSFFGK